MTDLTKRSEEYARTATPFAWQRTAIAAMFREVYAMACGDAVNLIESDPTGGSVGKQRTIDAIRRLAAKE